MSMMKIRGEQIKENQIEDRHIKGKLSEAVLDINFASHADEIFEEKLLMDYVQKNDVQINTARQTITFDSVTPPAADDNTKGIILNKYEVRLRNSITGEPIVFNDDGVEKPIYGKITSHVVQMIDDITNPGNQVSGHRYTVTFFVDGGIGVDTEATMPGGIRIDVLYPQRFSLRDIEENFAANERFVDAASDVTSHLNIRQIASEVFGSEYRINNTGDLSNPFNNGNTFVQEMRQETRGVLNTDVLAKNAIDEMVAARGGESTLSARLASIDQTIETEDLRIRTDLANEADAEKGAGMVHLKLDSVSAVGLSLTAGNATVQRAFNNLYNKVVADDNQIRADIASNDSGKGASVVGVEDAAAVFTATTVEGVLKELFDKINTDITTEANARIAKDNELQGFIDDIESEIELARGTMTTLDARLDVSLENDGQLKDYIKFHKHSTKHNSISVEGSTITEFTFVGDTQFTTPKETDHYTVYLNGIKQAPGLHYTISVQTNKVSVNFPDVLWGGDVVILESVIYAVPQK